MRRVERHAAQMHREFGAAFVEPPGTAEAVLPERAERDLGEMRRGSRPVALEESAMAGRKKKAAAFNVRSRSCAAGVSQKRRRQ